MAIRGEPLPLAVVDLDAFERNVATVLAPIIASGKRLRVATKSVRCPELLSRIAACAGEHCIGYLTFTAAETAFHAAQGVKDLLLAYPTMQAADAVLLAQANRSSTAATVVDCPHHLPVLSEAATREGVTIPVAIDLDMSWRPVGELLHIGVRRSPLREPADVVALAQRISQTPGLRFHGVQAYEAQIAGLADRGLLERFVKGGSRGVVVERRRRIVQALRAAGLVPSIVNGGGTGSAEWTSRDESVTELSAGSGFLAGHLFDGYRGLTLEPALAFALQVVRHASEQVVTCLGGGWIASGAVGADRLPLPVWPLGAQLLPAEGAGEVQTPVKFSLAPSPGSAVWFRPAKSGELAEHFNEYLLVSGETVQARAKTYRGLGHAFL